VSESGRLRQEDGARDRAAAAGGHSCGLVSQARLLAPSPPGHVATPVSARALSLLRKGDMARITSEESKCAIHPTRLSRQF